MHFTIPAGGTVTESDVYVKDARKVSSGGKVYYVFKCQVAAKELTSAIKAQIIDGDRSGTEYTYSVRDTPTICFRIRVKTRNGTKPLRW